MVMVSSTRKSRRRSGPFGFVLYGRHDDSEEQVWEDLSSNASEWCGNRPDKAWSSKAPSNNWVLPNRK